MSKRLDFLVGHYMFCLLALALVGLTVQSLGDAYQVAGIGILLCMAGFFQRPGKLDWLIMAPLLVYLLVGAVSSYVAVGSVAYTYTAPHAVYAVLYLLLSCLEEKERLWLRRLCVLWAAYMAAHGIVLFLVGAVTGSAERLHAILSNPNTVGIILVTGWFALTAWMPGDEEKGFFPALLRRLEPLLLVALALTLSMGSFLAMAVGMAVRTAGWAKEYGWRAAAGRAARMLAKCSVCVGTGLLMYVAGVHAPWLCFGPLLLLAAQMALWETFGRFLEARRWAPWTLCACGAAAALAALYLRPRATATFVERLDMMRNGLSYLMDSPLLGVGPYQWRRLNFLDSDPYYGTWHIHNALLHIGVENGLAAMAAMAVLAVRALQKKGRNVAGVTAFLVHCLIDASFFYLGATSMALLTAAEPDRGGKQLGAAAHKLFCGGFCLMFIGYCVFAPKQ